jgi:predicted dehydrogenase
VDCILNGLEPKFAVSGAAGLTCMKVVEGFYRSAAEGRTIDIKQ